MIKKIRLILFSLFVLLYLVIAPVLIFYSLGYRVDFENKKLVSIGGLYLKIWPREVNVLIDDKINKRTGLFSNQILIQGLFPKKHTILVKKEGYSSWQKSLEVKDKEVTKVENITLIKEKILFEKLKENVKNFYISSRRDLILLLNSSEYNFSIIDGQTRVEKNSFSLPENVKDNINVVSWDENLKTIILKTENNYFSVDYNKSGVIEPKITLFENDKELIAGGKLTFKKENGYIYLLNTQTDKFDKFYQANNIIFSPDKSKFLFFNDHEIFFAETKNPSEKTFLHRFSEKINDCFWLNNYYLIFNVGGQIKISEIDTRDKINTIELPQQILLTDGSFVELNKNQSTQACLSARPSTKENLLCSGPKIFWDETNKKLYILDANNVFVSEPLTDKNNK